MLLRSWNNAPASPPGVGPIIAEDPATVALLRRLDLVAASPATVMITGESGTGKRLLAMHLHHRSERCNGPFVALNCAAIGEATLDRELFGRDAGAAPADDGAAATADHGPAGKFQAADGGTLLLDEVNELDARMQAKLLRALQQHEQAAGLAPQPARPDVRIVATSTLPLMDAVQSGAFRTDLFFRLNVMTLKVPPLRERPGDIGPLATAFARRFAPGGGAALTPDALGALAAHPWPGNVRELENVIHRAVLTETGPLLTAASLDLDAPGKPGTDAPGKPGTDAPGKPGTDAPGKPGTDACSAEAPAPEQTGIHTTGRTIEAVEKDMILDTLCQCRGNRAQTANVLGISIRTLRNKLHEYERDGTRIPRPVIVAVA